MKIEIKDRTGPFLSASELAKSAGLPSLNYVQGLTGVRRNTLDNWHKHKPALYAIVIAGCVTALNRSGSQNE